MKTKTIQLLLLALLILSACQTNSIETRVPTGEPHQAPTLSVTPPSAPDTPTPIPTVTPTTHLQPVCTPPLCAANESYYCAGECPGGCGTGCATQTPTPTPTAAPNLRFAVIGDYGLAGPAAAAVAALVLGWQPDLILTTGDNNYPDGSAETIDANIGQYYHSYIYPYQGQYGPGAQVNRFFPALGNHDWNTAQAQPYRDYFELPGNEYYYDFVRGPVHFFAIDSDSRQLDGVGRSSIQAQWLQAGLAASTSAWQVVYFHLPPYSSGYHGSIDWMQWPFAEWGADVVLNGHDHVYERLFIDGIPHFTNGLGGYPARYDFITPLESSRVRYNAEHGALLVEASPTELSFTFENIRGEIIDTYRIQAELSQAAPTQVAPARVTAFPDPAGFTWTAVASGFDRPLGLVAAPDGSGRLFVLEQAGLIRIIQDWQVLASPFLDIRERVGDQGNEQGLLGLAFHPNYAENGFFYLNYTDRGGDTVIARFNTSPDPNQADPASESLLLRVSQPYSNHNGGHLVFGPDGYLYIGLGDGGSGGDPQGNAQNLETLLGKLLRIDVDRASPYGAPAGNPFIGTGRAEIWAWGLRNPWRFSFDSASGDLYLADVGQNQWEEINYLPAGSPPGANFGWDYYEAGHPFEGNPPDNQAFVAPIWEYDHSLGCSVSGGAVYRGAMPEWQGIYLYGDFCSGRIWGLLLGADGSWQNRLLFESGANITAFGEGPDGALYLVDRGGRILLLARIVN